MSDTEFLKLRNVSKTNHLLNFSIRRQNYVLSRNPEFEDIRSFEKKIGIFFILQ